MKEFLIMFGVGFGVVLLGFLIGRLLANVLFPESD
jgi:hypothetical protein